MRSAIDAEASRRGVTPSRVVEAVFSRYLPEFVAQAISEDLMAERERATRKSGAT
jgi:hypothetical protein